MHQGTKLKQLVDQSTKLNADIARLAGISEATLYNYFHLEEIDSRKLKKVLPVLEVEYTDFINPSKKIYPVESDIDRITMLEAEVEYLKQQVADKNEIIELLKKSKK